MELLFVLTIYLWAVLPFVAYLCIGLAAGILLGMLLLQVKLGKLDQSMVNYSHVYGVIIACVVLVVSALGVFTSPDDSPFFFVWALYIAYAATGCFGAAWFIQARQLHKQLKQ